jgi:hypothetical protein
MTFQLYSGVSRERDRLCMMTITPYAFANVTLCVDAEKVIKLRAAAAAAEG